MPDKFNILKMYKYIQEAGKNASDFTIAPQTAWNERNLNQGLI